MEKRTLTEVERKRLEALIRACEKAIDFTIKEQAAWVQYVDLCRRTLRDFDQPALWPGEADDKDLQAAIDMVHAAESARLDALLGMDNVKIASAEFSVEVEE